MKGATHIIKYRYVCEQCGKQTDWFSADIEEETSAYADVEIVSSILDKNKFKKQLQAFKEKVEGGIYTYHFQGGAFCPFCKARQSWMPVADVTTFSPAARIALYMCGWLFIGIALTIGVRFMEGDLFEWLAYDGWAILLFVPPFIGRGLAIRRNKKNTKANQEQQAAVTKRNKPEIDWNGV
jgi:hypothetical protein